MKIQLQCIDSAKSLLLWILHEVNYGNIKMNFVRPTVHPMNCSSKIFKNCIFMIDLKIDHKLLQIAHCFCVTFRITHDLDKFSKSRIVSL